MTYIPVISEVNIGSHHTYTYIMAMSNIKVDVKVERKEIMTKIPPGVGRYHTRRSKDDRIPT